MKLAPDWAAGQCANCQRVVQPSANTASRFGRAQGFGFILSMGWLVLGLARGFAAHAAFLPAVAAMVAIVLQAALIGGAAGCLLFVLLRRADAPTLVKVVLGVYAAFNLIVFVFEPFGAESLGRLVVNLLISVPWVVWFTVSPDVPRLFVNGAQRKP